VTLSGVHAFVADYSSGLQVIDISDPLNPTVVGTCDTPGNAHTVAVAGDYAYVGDSSSGLQVVDVSDPANPVLIGTYDTPGYVFGVAVSGERVFATDGGAAGLYVVDVSDPANPAYMGVWYCTPMNVCVAGTRAMVANQSSGLLLIDVSHPASPWPLGACDTPGYAYGVEVSGDYALVADQQTGLQVISMDDPLNPTLRGAYDTPGYAFGVAVSGEHGFVADGNSGLQMVRVYQSEVDTDRNAGRSRDVSTSGSLIFKARLMAAQTNVVAWELSADGGSNWQPVASNGSWTQLGVPGTTLAWRSTHAWGMPGVNPSVSGDGVGV